MAAQDALLQGIIDAINNQTTDLKYITVGPLGVPLPFDRGVRIALSFPRTADANIYTANDVVGLGTGVGGAILPFVNVRPAGPGEFMITSTELEIDDTGIIAGETSYNLYLYNSPPNSSLADNNAFDIGVNDRLQLAGKLQLGTPVDEGSTLYIRVDGVNQNVTLTGTNLYGYLATVGTYTPTSARVYKITLHGFPI